MFSSSLSRRALLLIVLVTAIGVVFLVLNGKESSKARLESYHFVARIEIEPVDRLDEPPITLMRAWYEAPDKWRQELGYSDPVFSDLTTVQVSDGESVWFLDGRTNTYYQQPLTDELRRSGNLLLGLSVPLGPYPLEILERLTSRPDTRSSSVRDDRLLGRDVQVHELEMEDGGRVALSIDRELGFVLRYESVPSPLSRDAGQSIRAEIVELDYNGGVEDARFHFAPPAGALEVEAPPTEGAGVRSSGSQASGPIGGREIAVPPGFLRPDYLPDGYVTVGFGSTSSSGLGGKTTALDIRLQPAGRRGEGLPVLRIQQQYRAGGLPASLRAGEATIIGSKPAYQTDTGGVRRLVWYQGDIVVSLTADTMPFEELRRIGESMR